MDRNYFLKNIKVFQQICIILQFQYVTKATFSSLQTIKVTFLILHHFPVLLLPLCYPWPAMAPQLRALPVVASRAVSP